METSQIGSSVVIRVRPDGAIEAVDLEDLEGLPIEWRTEVSQDLHSESQEIARALAALEPEGDEQGYLGVRMNLEGGMNVVEVLPGGGAAEAGLQAGDRILKIAGRSTAAEDLSDFLQTLAAGDTVKVVYARGERRKEARVRLRSLSALEAEVESESRERVGLEPVRPDLTDQAGGALGSIAIAIAGEDGEPQVIETRQLDLGDLSGELSFGIAVDEISEGADILGGDDVQVHAVPRVYVSGEGAERTIEVQVEAVVEGTETGGGITLKRVDGGHGDHDHGHDHGERGIAIHSRGIFLDLDEEEHGEGASIEGHSQGRVVIKRIMDGYEEVEEFEFDGELPEHVRELMREAGVGGAVHLHDNHEGEHVTRRVRIVRPGAVEGPGVFTWRAGAPGPDHEHDGHGHDHHEGHPHEGQAYGIFEAEDGRRARILLELDGHGLPGGGLGIDVEGLDERVREALEEHRLHHGPLERLHDAHQRRSGTMLRRTLGGPGRLFMGHRGGLRGHDFRGHRGHGLEEHVEELEGHIRHLEERIEELEGALNRLRKASDGERSEGRSRGGSEGRRRRR